MHVSTDKEIFQLRQFFEQSVDKYPFNTALICKDHSFTYQELEWRSNQLANYLIGLGINSTHSIGIFLERSVESYIAILAVLKAQASYVPIEIDYPDERVNYILNDMTFHSVITSTSQLSRQATIQFPHIIAIDQLRDLISSENNSRPTEYPIQPSQLAYVIYTSGSTGKPKGVEITQANICHYVKVASKLYQMSPHDKVYQGFSLAFDASLEELWMAFANGGTLVACTEKDIRSGLGLIEFLENHKVTVFSTVPTLLSTLKGNLPDLRLLILGGESCANHLIERWKRPNLRILNTYGPTEATVISTYAECKPNKPVTIGKPLAGYEVLLLNENLIPVEPGEQGELCIAGFGISRGYVNKPDMTAKKFITHPKKPNLRLYRTGDLAMRNAEGDLVFLGRIDDQVKLRGFRIELNEIEMILKEHCAINQAVVTLQELENPTLVAYLQLNNADNFDLRQFKSFLHQRLPHYMIPSVFEVIEIFPLLPSGKIDRKGLPKPKNTLSTTHYARPETALELEITKVFEEELQQNPISVEADFFYDLGGHSLSAAKIVSILRKMEGMQNLSILDLYLNPTIRKLAAKFNSVNLPKEMVTPVKKNIINSFSHSLCAMAQFFGCILQRAIGAWQFLAVILCFSWVATGGNSFSKETILVFLALFLGMPILSLTLTVCAKWILVGRVKPGVYKLWGWFYFRWWLAESLQRNIFSPRHLIGSPLINLYYRLLGAKIGKNCYIGSANVAVHDLLTIGDNSSIGLDARLSGYVIEDGWLKIGSISIGNRCFIGARSVVSINTILQDNSKLDDMSMLPANEVIPANQFYAGSPAKLAVVPPEHIINQVTARTQKSAATNFYYGMLHYLCLIFSMMLYYFCYFPAMLVITHFYEKSHYLLTVLFAIPLGAIVFLSFYYLGIFLCKKCIMNKIKPGIYSLKSFYYLRQWTLVKIVDIDEVYVLADSLYFPYFLRFLGAKLGKHVEMGETPHVIPDLVTILDGGFIASSAALAWPRVYLDSIKFAPVQVGKRGFIGNMSLLPLGENIGDGGLLGCMSITPPNNKAANHHTAWLGSPAMFLPAREIVTGYSDKEKFNPPPSLFYTRLAIEFARILMPTTFTLIGFFNLLYIINSLMNNYSLLIVFSVLPFMEFFIFTGLVGSLILLKWLILGKVKKGAKPIWNTFIWKNDVIEYTYSYFINSHFTSYLLGSPFISFLLRSLGSKIGKKACIYTANFTEFDLIHIGNEVCINPEAVIQTHLYEDRIFKMGEINIAEQCNIGVASTILYNTLMEKNSSLGNFSLLMKGENLPTNTSWQGIPAQPIHLDTQCIREDLKGRVSSVV